MKNQYNKAATIYWTGTMLQMAVICLILFLLRTCNIEYPQVVNLLFLLVGGTSSALWGIIVSLRFQYRSSCLEILKDFFRVRQSVFGYGMVILFILIVFGLQLFRGYFVAGIHWYSFLIFFVQAIVFGGIEEIGWRYTWQPIVEKRLPYEIASVITFASWGIWHYMYFYLTDTLKLINHTTFLIGLVGSCFIMAAIYRITHSLWLCVLYHCLLNVFSQTLLAGSLNEIVLCNAFGIMLAILIVRNEDKILKYVRK